MSPRGRKASLALVAAAVCAASGCDSGAGSAARPAAAASSPVSRAGPAPRFEDIAAAVGLDFDHFIGATGKHYFPEIMGPGCALLDYDNDGDLDVYLVQGKVLEPGKTLADAVFPWRGSSPPRNRLFRNELIPARGASPGLRFVDVTEASGTGISSYGMGVATGDYDNDGDVDLYLANFGPDVLLRNNGNGTFTDATAGSGLGDPRWNSSAAWFDANNDGRLDLVVAAYCDFTVATHKGCFMESGAREYCGPKAYLPVPCRLYRNLGGGRFEDVTARAGLDAAYGHGLGVVAGDFNRDGWQDLYVANDSDANQLWINHQGTFQDMALMSGAAFNEHGVPAAGMGIAMADHDDDGDTDLFVTNLLGETNTLFENRGDGTFEDATALRGLKLPSLPMTGFGVGWFDADNDSDLDLFLANGDVRLVEALLGKPFPYAQKNQLMIQVSRGRYEDRSAGAGPGLALLETSRGAAFGDVDNDGDVDILVSNDNGPVRLLRNGLSDPGGWMLLRVMDTRWKRDAIGATVRLKMADGRVLSRGVRTDGSYLCGSDPRVHFAWREQTPASLEVLLPDGRVLPVTGGVPRGRATLTIGPSGAAVQPGS